MRVGRARIISVVGALLLASSAARPPPTAAAVAALVGAGDIARCIMRGDEATAATSRPARGDDLHGRLQCLPARLGRELCRVPARPQLGRVLGGTAPQPWEPRVRHTRRGRGISTTSVGGPAWRTREATTPMSARLANLQPELGGDERHAARMAGVRPRWLEPDGVHPRLLAPAVVQLGTAWQQPRREAILVPPPRGGCAEVVVNGDDHDYERFAMLRPGVS